MWRRLGAAAVALAIAAPAANAEGLVRVRAIEIVPNTKSDPVGGVNIGNILAPDIDLNWMFNQSFATELLLTVPQQHHVTLNGADLGNAAHLPPTLLAQYRLPFKGVTPYIGAGINYTFFTDRKLNGGLQLERGSFGPALQLGADFPLGGPWSLNVDVKKIWIDADVSTEAGAFVTHVEINPLVAGVGVGYRF